MIQEEIKHIILKGKLSGYSIGGGFLQVQWTSPELEQGEFWLFKFTSADNKLVSVSKINTRYVYTRRQARKYVPMIEDLVINLLKPN
ncbi:hypothetical protein [uncultured Psychroserpens sp.]|uniref:hypothetical protein n=1 Tax=uncultured Psychroserpens sp. TaxID=255436 RepID=UPI00261250FE|nr:hypothetical protein [uncultured Psychroserpens sp.]